MFADQELVDTGTKRLLELGIRQQLHRPLHWTQNTMICFCILSSITCITGIGRQIVSRALPKQPSSHTPVANRRLVWSRPGVRGADRPSVGLGVCRDPSHCSWFCYE